MDATVDTTLNYCHNFSVLNEIKLAMCKNCTSRCWWYTTPTKRYIACECAWLTL